MIIFNSGRFLSKKNNQTKIFLKKKTETNLNRPVSVRFGFLEQKLVQTGLARFFRFGSVWVWFFRFGLVFPVRLGFSCSAWFWLGFVCLGSVRFGFFGFMLIKPNWSVFSKF
jgi:hypothetical protein